VPTHVADDHGAAATGQAHRVVPVAADAARGRWPVERGRLDRPQIRKLRQQQTLKFLRLAAHLAKQARVVDGQAGRAGQRDDHGLVVLVERLAVAPIRDIQVPERVAAADDRHPEQGPHLRVPRRQADRHGVVADRGDPQRGRVFPQVGQQAAPVGPSQRGHGGLLFFAQADREELDQVIAVVAEHPQHPISGIDQVDRGGDHLAQHGRQAEILPEHRCVQLAQRILHPRQHRQFLGDPAKLGAHGHPRLDRIIMPCHGHSSDPPVPGGRDPEPARR
jgi:hypothetical protein